MAKIDSIIEEISTGFKDSEIRMGTSWVQDSQIEQIGVRRKKAGETQHKLWYFSIGERGETPNMFWGQKFSDVLKKVMAWRGMATKNKRGSKKANP